MQTALGTVNRMVAAQALKLAPQHVTALRVLDLGCGVGGTLFDLHDELISAGMLVEGMGVSISTTQLHMAQRTAYERGLPMGFVTANFLDLPFRAHYDLVIGIESFVHAPNPIALYAAAAAVLRPGGRLIVCDDFLCDHAADHLLEAAFRRGWLAAGLLSVTQATAYAHMAGLRCIEQRNLTPELRLLRWPDRLVRLLLQIGLRAPLDWALMQNFVGGLALQHGLGCGVFAYQWLVFEKHEAIAP